MVIQDPRLSYTITSDGSKHGIWATLSARPRHRTTAGRQLLPQVDRYRKTVFGSGAGILRVEEKPSPLVALPKGQALRGAYGS